ncbi:ABC transporter ATP-binding protein [Pseudoruegeria sp. HB172150]|uniref:ABC transporter ATP-binding protein n=1 Tax=Pseudoruegeria sp. HB172150 TaxID=2721164 RepID=UPI001554C4AB|nr:ABC transporter ATP-binding protein [Pseudoruegeria sp. HB172150]
MADLSLKNVSRHFGGFAALKDLSLDVREGEFVSLLGPSGCGKSTTLGLIAGLDQPTSGRIMVGGRVVADGDNGTFVPAEDRELGLVLQSYALWPHMTVRGNISLPLEIRKVPKKRRGELVEEYLSLVEMSDYVDRYPHELSGGQQQRIALARTLVYEPVVLLLDEPLSNVDAKLRERARTWLRRLQRHFAVTTIFVTHDQSEALTMSDRVAVMSEGRLVQFGTPEEVYARPGDPFVADFVGSSNLIKGVLEIAGGDARLVVGDRTIRVQKPQAIDAGGPVTMAVRPEKIRVLAPGDDRDNVLDIEIKDSDFLGARSLYHADLGGQAIRFESRANDLRGPVRVGFSADDCFVFRG